MSASAWTPTPGSSAGVCVGRAMRREPAARGLLLSYTLAGTGLAPTFGTGGGSD